MDDLIKLLAGKVYEDDLIFWPAFMKSQNITSIVVPAALLDKLSECDEEGEIDRILKRNTSYLQQHQSGREIGQT